MDGTQLLVKDYFSFSYIEPYMPYILIFFIGALLVFAILLLLRKYYFIYYENKAKVQNNKVLRSILHFSIGYVLLSGMILSITLMWLVADWLIK